MHISHCSLLTLGTLLVPGLTLKLPFSPRPTSKTEGAASNQERQWIDDSAEWDSPPPGLAPPPPGWAPPPGWNPPPGWALHPPLPPPPQQDYEPQADQAWGIVFGRGPDASASFQPVFSETALAFINLFDQCSGPSDYQTCTNAAMCRWGIRPYCVLSGQPLQQFSTDLCDLGLAGVCRRGQIPGKMNAETAFTWGLMVGGIRPNGTNPPPPPPYGFPNPPHPPPPGNGSWPPPPWPTVTVTTTWVPTVTETDTQTITSTETDLQTTTSTETDWQTTTSTSTITSVSQDLEWITSTTVSWTTATVTFTPPPPPPNPIKEHIFNMGLSLQAALKCTGHEASDRCKDSDLCSWGVQPFCASSWQDQVAQAEIENRLCKEGIGIFCRGDDVDQKRAFLAEVMRAVARVLNGYDHGLHVPGGYGGPGGPDGPGGPPPRAATSSASSAATSSASSSVSAAATSTPTSSSAALATTATARRESEETKPSESGKVWGSRHVRRFQ